MGLKMKLGRFARHYQRDASGQFAVITALVGLPLLLLTASAYDINMAHNQNEGVRAAIDAAALAAVIPDNMTDPERYAYAQTVFDNNYFGRDNVALNVTGDRERVEIVATSKVPTTISGILGVDYVDVREETAAVLTRADIVCLLALDPEGDRALEFSDQAIFNSPACSVQVNSTSPFAMVSGVVTPPLASSFCVSGISQGVFAPLVKHACTPVEDPFANLIPPEDGPCLDIKGLKGNNSTIQSFDDLTYDDDDGNGNNGNGNGNGNAFGVQGWSSGAVEYDDIIGSGGVLVPGTYCNGLKIHGANVKFLPGTYIMKRNGIEFKEYSGAIGIDVTIVLKGEKSKLKIKDNSQVYLKAPSTGTYAGLVFYQTPVDGKNNSKKKKKPKKKNDKIEKSEIVSGGGLNIIGTAYFPTQELKITSLNPVVTQSPATSFIAYRLKVGGRANLQIHVDHEAGGIPPLLPRSDDGARLVR